MTARRHRIAACVIDYAHSDDDLKDPVIVRSDLSDDENRARVQALCPWAATIQRENNCWCAYEDTADAVRAAKRLHAMGIRTNAATPHMIERVRIHRRQS